MRNVLSLELRDARIRDGLFGTGDEAGPNGAFELKPKLQGSPGRDTLRIIASEGNGAILWEHVSVSIVGKTYTPTWEQMCYVKDLFWYDNDVVVQYHPAKSNYVNNHPGTLHLFRPTQVELPTPPDITVGIKALGTLR